MLTVGQPLLDFTGEALMPNGEFGPLKLCDYKGKWIVLFFYPLDFTLVCPAQIKSFNRLQAEFAKLDAVVLGASVDSVHCHKAWTEHGLGKIDFPLIGDLTRELTIGCGVMAPEGFAQRATFIANPDGVIESVTINSSNNVARSTEETLSMLQALQAAGRQPGQAVPQA